MIRRSFRKAVVVTAVTVLTAAGVGGLATQASASTGANIDQYDSSYCQDSPYPYCLWYNSNGSGAGWGSEAPETAPITGTFFLTNNAGSAGVGQKVRNNAASMANGTANCEVVTWYNGDETGNWNELDPDWGGNLTPALHNNEASIAVLC